MNELIRTNEAPTTFDMDAVYRTLNLNPHDPKAQALFLVCERYNLDPLLKHVVLITGTIYVTRDGLLHVAHASGKLDGMKLEYLGLNAEKTHHEAIATIYRKDMTHPFVMRGRYPVSGRLSKDYGPEMAEKVATCRGLRSAFDVSLCSREEMWDQAEQEVPTRTAPTPTPKQIDADEPQKPRYSLLTQAQLAFAAVADERKYDVRTETGEFSLSKFGSVFLRHMGIEPKAGTLSDWQIAADSLPIYSPAPVETAPTADPRNAPAPVPTSTEAQPALMDVAAPVEPVRQPN